MSFLQSMQNRYTTKNYDNSKSISDQQIQDLKEILRLSPSSINSQPWLFTFVRSQSVKEELSKVSWVNTERVTNCDTVFVFGRPKDGEIFKSQIEEYLPQRAINYFDEFLRPLPEVELRAWFEKQVYLSVGVLLSACAQMSIDATPMEGIEPENYDKILQLVNYKTVVAVAIGHRTSDDFNQPSLKPKARKDLDKVVIEL